MIGRWWRGVCQGSLAVQAGVLVALVALAAAIAAPIAWSLSQGLGMAALGLALGLCLAGGVLALAFRRMYRRPEQVLVGVLLAMAARTGIPLAGVVAVHLRETPLANAGMLYYVGVFYLLTLTVETAMSLSPGQERQAQPAAIRPSRDT